MCNFCCFENRRTQRRCTCIWSFLACLSGGGVIYFSTMLMYTDLVDKVEENIEYMNEYKVREYLFFALFTLGAFIVIFGCFGAIFKWMRNRCCTVLFGMCLTPLWIATVAIGGASVYISYTAADEFQDECDKLVADRLVTDKKIVFSLENDNLEINFNIYRDVQIDKYMCSVNCPCDVVDQIPIDPSLLPDLSQPTIVVPSDQTNEETVQTNDEESNELPAGLPFAPTETVEEAVPTNEESSEPTSEETSQPTGEESAEPTTEESSEPTSENSNERTEEQKLKLKNI